ncbi:MAG TPA: hypothetical protein VFZ21_01410, partial [Gemmatimonadaceae bacterium]|nr:hypothetical protein [Gemmatimonadaceae bacterium]
ARNILEGPERIARFLLGLNRKYAGRVQFAIVELNGQPAIVSYYQGRVAATTSFETDGTRILAVYRVLNPDKLRHLNGARPSGGALTKGHLTKR